MHNEYLNMKFQKRSGKNNSVNKVKKIRCIFGEQYVNFSTVVNGLENKRQLKLRASLN